MKRNRQSTTPVRTYLEVAARRLVVAGQVGVGDAHVEPPARVLGLEVQSAVFDNILLFRGLWSGGLELASALWG